MTLRTTLTALAIALAPTAQAIDVRALTKLLDVQKGEFETTAQFEARRAKAAPIDKDLTLAWKVETASYDADAQVLTVEVVPEGQESGALVRSEATVTGTYQAINAFGVRFPVTEGRAVHHHLKAADLPPAMTIKVAPEVAKRLKPTLWLVADFRLLPGEAHLEQSTQRIRPTFESRFDTLATTYVISAQLERLRLQEGPQGKVWATFDAAAARKDRERAEQQEAQARESEEQRLRTLAREREAELERQAAEYRAEERVRKERRAKLEAMVPSFDGDRETALLVAAGDPAAPTGALMIGCKEGEKFVVRVGTTIRIKKTWALGQDLTDVRYAFDDDDSHWNWERFGLSEAGPMSSLNGFVEDASKAKVLKVHFEVEEEKERRTFAFNLGEPTVREHLLNLRRGCK